MNDTSQEVPPVVPPAGAATRSAELARHQRYRMLSDADRDIIRLANEPGFARWLEQITATGGCAHPVYLSGSTTTHDAATDELLSAYTTIGEPSDRLPVRCRNRRASVCAPCSRLHAGDTFHLIRAGLAGGKTVPDSARHHPRLFVTLTAPSFGAVHRSADGQPCHPRRNTSPCDHGLPQACGLVHADTDPAVGQPLCPACYDYPAHVLWHAHAGRLWDRFTTAVRRHLASVAEVPRAQHGEHLTVSFAKVAEYQRRAAVHFHAVIRLDGPDGPHTRPPERATEGLLLHAVRHAVSAASVALLDSDAYRTERLTFGDQYDARPIRAFGDGETLSDDAVSAYVAKYVGKGATETGAGLDHPLTGPADIRHAAVTPHVRALMGLCWRLGSLPELEHLRLRAWAHTLGYRGHTLTKSRRYSTTYAALRSDRADHRQGSSRTVDDPHTLTDSAWRYVGSGHTPGATLLAAGSLTTSPSVAKLLGTSVTSGERSSRKSQQDGGREGAM